MVDEEYMQAERVKGLVDKSDRLLASIGDVLRDKRATLGISQRKLASLSEVSKSFIHDIESGVANPTWAILTRVCRELDISLADLVV